MSLRRDLTAEQAELVYDSIKTANEPMTLGDIATIHGFSYYTARNYVNMLISEGRVRANPKRTGSRNNAVAFEITSAAKMPTLGPTPLWRLLCQQASNPDAGPSVVDNYRVYLQVISDLFVRAESRTRGNTVKQADLLDLRTRLVTQRKYLQTLLDGYDNLLNNAYLWDPDNFWKTLLTDDKCPVAIDDIPTVTTAISGIVHRYRGKP